VCAGLLSKILPEKKKKKGSTAEIKYENTTDEISVSKRTYKAAEGTFLRSHKPSSALPG